MRLPCSRTSNNHFTRDVLRADGGWACYLPAAGGRLGTSLGS
jgi:hypothetical protein